MTTPYGFSHTQIIRQDDPEDVYMDRWIFACPLFTIRLHRINRSDMDPQSHSHPWNFVSLVLRGVYHEHRYHAPEEFRIGRRRAGSLAFRRKTDFHKVILPNGPVWTLCVTSAPSNSWGFWMPDGSVESWKTYAPDSTRKASEQ